MNLEILLYSKVKESSDLLEFLEKCINGTVLLNPDKYVVELYELLEDDKVRDIVLYITYVLEELDNDNTRALLTIYYKNAEEVRKLEKRNFDSSKYTLLFNLINIVAMDAKEVIVDGFRTALSEGLDIPVLASLMLQKDAIIDFINDDNELLNSLMLNILVLDRTDDGVLEKVLKHASNIKRLELLPYENGEGNFSNKARIITDIINILKWEK